MFTLFTDHHFRSILRFTLSSCDLQLNVETPCSNAGGNTLVLNGNLVKSYAWGYSSHFYSILISSRLVDFRIPFISLHFIQHSSCNFKESHPLLQEILIDCPAGTYQESGSSIVYIWGLPSKSGRTVVAYVLFQDGIVPWSDYFARWAAGLANGPVLKIFTMTIIVLNNNKSDYLTIRAWGLPKYLIFEWECHPTW